MKLLPSTILTLTFLASTAAAACSGPPPPATVKEAYREAKYIYLAIAENITRTPIPVKYDPNLILEEANFRVLEVWKGDLKPGDIVKYKEEVDGYSCHSNIKNNPAWFREEGEFGEMLPEFSGIWLIYTSQKNEIGGFIFTRSNPLEYGGIADIKELYKITLKRNQ